MTTTTQFPARDRSVLSAGHASMLSYSMLYRAGYSFGTLIAAQAAGDLLTLRTHGLPAERVRLERSPASAARARTERIAAVLAGA